MVTSFFLAPFQELVPVARNSFFHCLAAHESDGNPIRIELACCRAAIGPARPETVGVQSRHMAHLVGKNKAYIVIAEFFGIEHRGGDDDDGITEERARRRWGTADEESRFRDCSGIRKHSRLRTLDCRVNASFVV